MNQLLSTVFLLIVVLLFFYLPDVFFGIVLFQMVGKVVVILSTGQGWPLSYKIDEVIRETTNVDNLIHTISFILFTFLLFSTGDYMITGVYVIIGLFNFLNMYIRKRQLKWI